mgnify:FL=1
MTIPEAARDKKKMQKGKRLNMLEINENKKNKDIHILWNADKVMYSEPVSVRGARWPMAHGDIGGEIISPSFWTHARNRREVLAGLLWRKFLLNKADS